MDGFSLEHFGMVLQGHRDWLSSDLYKTTVYSDKMLLTRSAAPTVPEDEGHTYVSRRFDRTRSGVRKAFVSAMTMLQRKDGEPGASYLELVELLQTRGANTRSDCAQLFRRVVFNICVSNTDDHLRNHGFFIEANGLVLSPAYDMNPNTERGELSIAIDEVNTSCDVDVALRAASGYGLGAADADAIVTEVRTAVAKWRDEAASMGIARGEQNRMQTAFR
ncbi:MAG: HipA domain-containing protein [Betaproteobacteria bacterium]|nr:HipA domain-containing protein [Betaproteobacteria bacterium]